MSFEPITTQEAFDAAIKDRLERERAKFAGYEDLKAKAAELEKIKAKDYEGQIKALQEELRQAKEAGAGHDKSLAEVTAKLKTAEGKLLRAKVAQEKKLPYELADRLQGETEEELRKDAEGLARYVTSGGVLPLASAEKGTAATQEQQFTAALAQLNADLRSQ